MKKEKSKLIIKSFHITEVNIGDSTNLYDRTLGIDEDLVLSSISGKDEFIKSIELKIIYPNERRRFINSILDFSPIATKVIGNLGEGVTHVLTGATVMITGVDENGVQVAEFGSSEGILEDQVVFNRAGTPKDEDIIVHFDVVLKDGMGSVRKAITETHKACDFVVQSIREKLKKISGSKCDERHEFIDSVDEGKKNIVIVKQVAGQGAMYDTAVFPKEPGGVEGSKSIIDLGNMPIILTPNEYRDGALRAMH